MTVLLHRLFVAPRPAWPLAIARIGLGLVVVAWTLSLIPDASTFFGDNPAFGPEVADERWSWTLPLDSPGAAWTALALLAVAGVMICVGWHPTPWFLVAFVLLVAVERRNPLIINSGDLILRDLMLLMALTPSGAALSVDRWRAHGRDALWTSPMVAPWGLRLVQAQVMVVYLTAFWFKRGDEWAEGTAVSTALRLDDLARFPVPDLFVDHVLVVAALTWGTLAVEAALGTLLWVRRLRPILVPLGVALHLFIGTFLMVGFFSLTMICALMTFLDADAIDRRIARRRRRDQGGGGAPHGDTGFPPDAPETELESGDGTRKPTSAPGPPVSSRSGRSVAQTVPPWRSTIWATIARPRPEPGIERVASLR